MDMDVSGRTATITSFGTGDASFYLSTGGGTIGSGQASEEVAAAAKKFVAAAAQYVDSMTKADKQRKSQKCTTRPQEPFWENYPTALCPPREEICPQ